MIDFNEVFKKTIKFEGGYSLDPDDPGGETYKGISRIHHPYWSGWEKIDDYKESGILGIVDKDHIVHDRVRLFYETHYWRRIRGKDLYYQNLAEVVFDTAVNMGVHKGIKCLQESLNLLNRNQKDYPDLIKDGLIGRKTLGALNTYLNRRSTGLEPEILITVYKILRGYHYVQIMRKSQTLEKFAKGWFKRIL